MKNWNLVKQIFGDLYVQNFSHYEIKNNRKLYIWKCKCLCDEITYIDGTFLTKGYITECQSCENKKIKSIEKELVGNKYSFLTILKFSEKRKGQNFWLCQCDCGNEIVVNQHKLMRRKIKSCGCVIKWKLYPPEWNKKLKSKILQRDSYNCQYPNCNYNNISGKLPSLHVHHINGIKMDCRLENLISLCPSHHVKVEVKPDSWVQYFTSKIMGYNYHPT